MATNVGGRRLVVALYGVIVCFTGVAGYLAAGVVGEIEPPRFLFLIPFPATRLGLAAYGALTIALILGVLLIAVTVVADRVDDVEPTRNRSTEAEESTPATEENDE
ncbi:cox cluster protein [Halonotius sp. F2-221B]|uniref:DUF7520 family protein n=1 Tax=Halonotius sp. F2-221B TaxID=2731620 RepID=UPI00398A8B82